MDIWPQCIPCILNVRSSEIINSRLTRGEKIRALKRLLEEYAGWISEDISTIELATLAFKLVKELIGEEDPYREFKEESYRIAEDVARSVREKIEGLRGYEKFRAIVVAMVYANILDPGAPLGLGPDQLAEKILGGRLARDETRELFLYLLQVDRVVFLLDNAGEAVFDKLFLEEISKINIELVIVAKDKPYQNDITYDEALGLGLNKYGKLIGTGGDAGPIPGMASDELLNELNEADLIIAKGMANFEAFIKYPPNKPSFHMLVAKCVPVASMAGVNPGEAAAFFYIKPRLLKFR